MLHAAFAAASILSYELHCAAEFIHTSTLLLAPINLRNFRFNPSVVCWTELEESAVGKEPRLDDVLNSS